MTTKQKRILKTVAMGLVPPALLVLVAGQAIAHKEPHDAATLKAFQDVFMEQVVLGDRLFHGDADAEKEMGV